MSLELCIWVYIELVYVCFFVFSPFIWLYIACYRFFYVFIAFRWVYMGCDMLLYGVVALYMVLSALRCIG